jgi:hypothetical protein
MAKAAKEIAAAELNERRAKKFTADILEHDQNIAAAKSKYDNARRKEQEAQVALYEGLTPFGISQKASKIYIKVKRAELKISGWLADLDAEQRKQHQKLAKAQGDKRQLSFLSELEPIAKPTKTPREKSAPVQTDIEDVQAAGSIN